MGTDTSTVMSSAPLPLRVMDQIRDRISRQQLPQGARLPSIRAMAEMQKALADMPPAQRKQMEQMMAQRGVGMTAGPWVALFYGSSADYMWVSDAQLMWQTDAASLMWRY